MSDLGERTDVAGRRGKGYFLPGAIALGALLLIGAGVGAGDLSHPAPHRLAGSDVASQVSLGIQMTEHSRTPPAVSCPGQEPVRAGLRFTCQVSPSGGHPGRTAEITEIDGRGHLRWSLVP